MSADGAPAAGSAPAALRSKTGGVYMPPHKLAALRAEIKDKESIEYQRLNWESLRKGVNGLVNKVNTSNMVQVVGELFQLNLVRGRGLLCRAVLKAQMASPGFSHIYAALIAVVNTKLPEIGELLLKRTIIQFRRAYRRNNKVVAVALARLLAHLVNQQVAHELVALQMMTLLLEKPSDDSVEVAIGFVKECGQLLSELTPAGINAIFDRFRAVLHEGDIDKRVQYMIEALFAVRKARFADHPSVLPELDLVEREDQITHEVALDEGGLEGEEELDVFQADPTFAANEEAWAAVRTEVLGAEGEADGEEAEAAGGEGASGLHGREHAGELEDADGAAVVGEEEAAGSGAGAASASLVPAAAAGSGAAAGGPILDMSETDLINLRRTIYLTIMNSLDFEECAHKLTRLGIPRGAEAELANMLIECCSQEKTFLRYFALLARRFCMISSVYQEAFEAAFEQQYAGIHRLETNKLRNVAKLFAYLLQCDALPWTVLAGVRLTEEDTTSASRIFVKIVAQELSEYLGLHALRERFADPSMRPYFAGLFPDDDPRHTRFAINFFTSVGLGALTDDLRLTLKRLMAAPPPAPVPAPAAAPAPQPAVPAAERRSRSRSASSDSRSSYSESESSRSPSRSRGRGRGRGRSDRSPSASSYSSSSSYSSYTSSSSSRSRSASPSEDRKGRGAGGREHRTAAGKPRGRHRSPSSSRSRSGSSYSSYSRSPSSASSRRSGSASRSPRPHSRKRSAEGRNPASTGAAAPRAPAASSAELPRKPSSSSSAAAAPARAAEPAGSGAASSRRGEGQEGACRARDGRASGPLEAAPREVHRSNPSGREGGSSAAARDTRRGEEEDLMRGERGGLRKGRSSSSRSRSPAYRSRRDSRSRSRERPSASNRSPPRRSSFGRDR